MFQLDTITFILCFINISIAIFVFYKYKLLNPLTNPIFYLYEYERIACAVILKRKSKLNNNLINIFIDSKAKEVLNALSEVASQPITFDSLVTNKGLKTKHDIINFLQTKSSI
ncbi:hypothetical protein L3V86_09235 [Thiotrichales bacterium 19S11-10]|nr:hypothetical protein [Thiotrichales bacterium 19S11-10]